MTMKIKTLLGLLICLPLLLAAQEEPEAPIVRLAELPERHQTRIFGDRVNVRVKPSKDAAVLDQLLIGDPVTVLATDTSHFTLNGWSATWSKISYNKAGQRKEGYVWNGMVSPLALEKDGVAFVYNITRSKSRKVREQDYAYEESEQEVEVRAVRDGKIISSVVASLRIDNAYETQSVLYNNLGMKGYRNVLRFYFNFPACGYSSFEWWCLWDGSKLTPLPMLTSFGDAGTVYESESYVFPEIEGGLPEKLLYRYELNQGMEMEGEYDSEMHLRPMIWNGKNFVKPKVKK